MNSEDASRIASRRLQDVARVGLGMREDPDAERARFDLTETIFDLAIHPFAKGQEVHTEREFAVEHGNEGWNSVGPP